MSAKADFLAYCKEHGLEVEHTNPRSLCHHVHIYAPAGKTFVGHTGLNGVSVWDSDDGAPDWAYCLREIQEAMPLESDPNPDEEER